MTTPRDAERAEAVEPDDEDTLAGLERSPAVDTASSRPSEAAGELAEPGAPSAARPQALPLRRRSCSSLLAAPVAAALGSGGSLR